MIFYNMQLYLFMVISSVDSGGHRGCGSVNHSGGCFNNPWFTIFIVSTISWTSPKEIFEFVTAILMIELV